MSLTLDIKKQYSDFSLDIKFDVGNEIIGLLGNSGSGKSLTLKAIAGLIKPDTGIIKLNDKTVFSRENKINVPTRYRKCGFLFQNYALFPNMTVLENVRSVLKEDRKNLAEEYLSRFHVENLKDKKPKALSGGQQQRVALARMMASTPDIIMLDEPFSALDTTLKWKMENEMLSFLKEYKQTSILVSHDKDESFRICDKIAVIDHGRLLDFDKKERIFNSPKTIECAQIIGINNTSPLSAKDGLQIADKWDIPFKLNGIYKHIAFDQKKFSLKRKEHFIDVNVKNLTENTTDYVILATGQKDDEFITFAFDKNSVDYSDLDKENLRLYYDYKDLLLFK